MTIRRETDPINLKRIWNAVKTANHHRVMADTPRITKYLQNYYAPTQVEQYIKQALNDKLLVRVKKNDSPAFKIPLQDELPPLDGKDWYCFECHLAGEVTECKSCFRVFHQNCIMAARKKYEEQRKTINFAMHKFLKSSAPATSNNKTSTPSDTVTIIDDDDPSKRRNSIDAVSSATATAVDKSKLIYDDTLCSACNIRRIDVTSDMDKTEVNYLLKFVLHRIRAWIPNTITQTLATEDTPEWLSASELTWRANQLFCQHTDMSVIEVKINSETYTMFADFLADVYTVHHNVAIFHGIESQEFGAAELMVKDTNHDMAEMGNCIDCYKHSNEKSSPKWFCLPCRMPHELVWAKQKGYPYWPAKVMKETDLHYDVRFFGGKYERSMLLKTFVKPIDISKESLMIKPSTAFNKAFEELRYHQKLLRDPVELEKLLAECKAKRKSLPKQKTPLPRTPIKKVPKKSISKTPKTKEVSRASMPSTSKDKSSSSQPTRPPSKRPLKRKQPDKDFISTLAPTEDKKRRKSLEETLTNSPYPNNNVIDISDGEEEETTEYSYRQNNSSDAFHLEESYEQVTSSTENFGKLLSPQSEFGMQPLDQPYSDSVEKMRRKLECLPSKKEMIKCAMDCMQIEIDRITNDHNEHLKRLFESHNQQISETKKKQWCYNCEQDAIYHCCWNTAYCSQTCQQQHWQAEHKKVCRRKR